MIIQRLFGLFYISAGIAKAFPEFEDVSKVLYEASLANQNTVFGGVSQWLSDNSLMVTVFVGVVLFLSGAVLLLNKGPVKKVIYAQMVMLIGFVTLLHNSHPQVIVFDSIFFVAAIMMLRQHNQTSLNNSSRLVSNNYENLKTPEAVIDEKSSDEYDVVIIGGGVSGLTSAFELQDKKVLLLEKSPVFGGNARYSVKNGLRHPTAGVCFQRPVAGSDIERLLEKLNLKDKWKDTEKDTIVFFDTKLLMACIGEVLVAMLKHPGQLVKPVTWKLAISLIFGWITAKRYVVAPRPLGEPIFSDLYQFLEQFSPTSGKYPSMPWKEGEGWSREEMECLDEISLYTLLFEPEKLGHVPAHLKPTKAFGRLVESTVVTTLRIECLSIHDVSAYVGLHFLVGYLRGVLVTLPGGTGSISHALFAALESNSNITFMAQADVKCIETDTGIGFGSGSGKDLSRVSFDQGGKHYSVLAKSIIWAAPKHAVGRVIPDLPGKQKQAISQIAYHDYCLANVYLDRAVMSRFFGGYVIEPDNSKNELEWCKTGVTLVPHWMDDGYDKDYGILSMLKPVAFKEDQGKLLAEEFSRIQSHAYGEIAEQLSTINVDKKHIQDIKLWQWKKGLVVSSKGQMKNNVFAEASSQYKNICFANHDRIGIGNIESAIGAGFAAADDARTYLQGTEKPVAILN